MKKWNDPQFWALVHTFERDGKKFLALGDELFEALDAALNAAEKKPSVTALAKVSLTSLPTKQEE